MLRALMDEKLHSVKEIAEEQLLPQAFAYKIVKKLGQAGILEVIRGTSGGCRLRASLDDTSLYDVVRAMDTDSGITVCMDPAYVCAWRQAHDGCSIHSSLAVIQRRLDDELRAHSLREILQSP